VVGGGFKFEGAQQWLQYKVWVGMPPQYRLMLETMDVMKSSSKQYINNEGNQNLKYKNCVYSFEGRAVILVIMFVKTFKTDVIVFIGNIIMC
jgi:hypothetical protein